MSFLQIVKNGEKKREAEEEFRLFRLKYYQVLVDLLHTTQRINNNKEKEIQRQRKIPPPDGTMFSSCDVEALVSYNSYTFLCTFTYLSDREIKFWVTNIKITVLFMRGTYESCKGTFLRTIPECYSISPDSVNLKIVRI